MNENNNEELKEAFGKSDLEKTLENNNLNGETQIPENKMFEEKEKDLLDEPENNNDSGIENQDPNIGPITEVPSDSNDVGKQEQKNEDLEEDLNQKKELSNQEMLEKHGVDVEAIALSKRSLEKEIRKIKLEFSDYQKNSVSLEEHTRVKTQLENAKKTIAELRSQFQKIENQK